MYSQLKVVLMRMRVLRIRWVWHKMAVSYQDTGYECSLVDDVPVEVQTECSICLLILREPCLVSCCGYRFCQKCLEAIEAERKPCPLCNKQFQSLPDRQLERTLKEKRVYCSNKSLGCEWIGYLSEYESHLNAYPGPGPSSQKWTGCKYHKLQCSHCDMYFMRSEIVKHEDICMIPILCPHCKKHSDTLANLESEHYSQCLMYPVSCPNGCGATPFRNNVHKHVENVCPLTPMMCAYQHIGCRKKLTRKDLSQHYEDNKSEHFTLAMEKLSEAAVEKIALEEEIESKTRELEELRNNKSVHSVIKHLCVTNLPSSVNEGMLKSLFGQFGRVEDIELNCCVAQVEYESESSAQVALERSETRGINLKSYKLCVHPVYC